MSKRLPLRAWSMTLALALAAAGANAAEPSAEGQFEQGLAAFERGALEQAVVLWGDAAQRYEKQGQIGGRISALMHLAHAQSGLGQYRQATVTLGTALDLAQAAGACDLPATQKELDGPVRALKLGRIVNKVIGETMTDVEIRRCIFAGKGSTVLRQCVRSRQVKNVRDVILHFAENIIG